MNTTLWRKIPPDVMINNIMPYSYRTIDATLLCDIRSFIHDYRIIINYYYFDMNEYVLLNDLIWFCNNSVIHGSVCNNNRYPYITILNIINILNRNPIFCKWNFDRKFSYIKKTYYNNITKNMHSKNMQILSLLTPDERSEFISQHIIIIY